MVDETGGRAYFPTKLSDMSAEFTKIENELRSQYSLSFTPVNPSTEPIENFEWNLATGNTRLGHARDISHRKISPAL